VGVDNGLDRRYNGLDRHFMKPLKTKPAWKHKRTCQYPKCGLTFTPKQRHQDYHTPKCRVSHWNEVHPRLTRDSKKSLRPHVKNPIVDCPGFEKLKQLPKDARHVVIAAMNDVARYAEGNYENWKARNRLELAAYWKTVSILTQHAGRKLR
jgi:hypothetical protein